MNKRTKERKRLVALYHSLYTRHYIEELHTCFYCAEPAETVDHVPPLSWIEAYGIDNLRKAKVPLSLIPSCRECNSLLGDKKLLHIDERLSFLSTKYHNLFDKVVRWTDDEIAEMGPSFQQSLKAPRHRERQLSDKIRALEQRTVKPWTWPDFIDYSLEDIS